LTFDLGVVSMRGCPAVKLSEMKRSRTMSRSIACKLILSTLAILFCSIQALAAEYTVTPDMSPERAIEVIESAGAGDVVLIEPGTYQFRVYLQKDGVTIKGSDPNNRPVFDYAGKDVDQWPGSDSGKIHRWAWQIQADNITVEDLVIQGAVHRADRNSSTAIFLGPLTIYREPTPPDTIPENITLRNLLLRDNDEGLTGTAHNVLVERCEFHGNGDPSAKNPRHNVYLQGGSAVFRFCHIHAPAVHANLSLRTKDARIEYCDIGPWGEGSSHGIQLLTDKAGSTKGESYQQTLTLIGNKLSGVREGKKGMSKFIFLGNTNKYAGNRMRLNMYYNTFEGEKGNFGHIVQLLPGPGQEKMEVFLYNNVFKNNYNPIRYSAGDVNDPLYNGDIRHNWFPKADYGKWSLIMQDNVIGGDPIRKGAGAANMEFGEVPKFEPLGNPRSSALNLGAYE